MKASESIEKYPARVREYTNYAIKSIKNVCKLCGPRPVGSEGEAKAIDYALADAEKFCDEARKEPLKASDKAFMSWVSIGAVMMVLSNLLYSFGLVAVSFALTVLTLFFIVGEFILYFPVLDVFFKKKKTANVVGLRKASGEVKRKIILSGHIDSAYEWTYTYHGGRPAVATSITSAIIGITLSIVGCIVAFSKGLIFDFQFIITGDDVVLKVFSILFYVLIPFFIASFFFCNYKRPVVGANDDLTGSFVALSVAKFLSDNDIRFENTEVEVLLSAGEEAGLRGAVAYAKAHADEIKNSDVQTVFVGFDTIRDFDFMTIINKDLNGMLKSDSRVVELINQAAANAGYDNVSINPISLGSTDSAAMTRAGVPSATFVAMDPTPAKYYHTRLDTEDNLEPKTIEAGVKIALETVFLFDEKGI